MESSAASAINFIAVPPQDRTQRVKLHARSKPTGRLTTGRDLLEALLVRFGERDAYATDTASSADPDRPWLLRNTTRACWLPLEESIEGRVEENDILEPYDRSVAGVGA